MHWEHGPNSIIGKSLIPSEWDSHHTLSCTLVVTLRNTCLISKMASQKLIDDPHPVIAQMLKVHKTFLIHKYYMHPFINLRRPP